MKIKEITDEAIIFDNGTTITYEHDPDCCEENYPVFKYLKGEAGVFDRDFPEDIAVEGVKDFGFRFGGKFGLVSVPCYSIQMSGMYSTAVDIVITYPDSTKKIVSIDGQLADPIKRTKKQVMG